MTKRIHCPPSWPPWHAGLRERQRLENEHALIRELIDMATRRFIEQYRPALEELARR